MSETEGRLMWVQAAELLLEAVHALSAYDGSGAPPVGASVNLGYDPFEGIAGDVEEPWEAAGWYGQSNVIDEAIAARPDVALRELLDVLRQRSTPTASTFLSDVVDPGAPASQLPGCGLEEPQQRVRVADLLARLAAITEQLPPEDGNTVVSITWGTSAQGDPDVPPRTSTDPAERRAWWWTVHVFVGDYPDDPDGLIYASGTDPAQVLTSALTRTQADVAERHT